MQETDLTQVALIARIMQEFDPNCLGYAEDALKNWSRYGGFETVRDLFLKTVFDPSRFERVFSAKAFILDSSIDRYHLIAFLIEEGALDRRNLEGRVIDIGCHLGATVDALSMYGGEVVGTDCGEFTYESPSGIGILGMEGRLLVRNHSSMEDKPTLISCFNVGWVENMSHSGFVFELCKDSLASLKPKGQVLYTFSEDDLGRYERLTTFADSKLIRIPRGLCSREKYAFTLTNPNNN